MRKIMSVIATILCMMLVFTAMVSLPALFIKGKQVGIYVGGFFKEYIDVILKLLHPEQLKINTVMQIDTIINGVQIFKMKAREFPLFPFVLEPYMYSMFLLIGSLFLAIVVSFSCSVIVTLLSKRLQQVVKTIFSFLKTVPDVFLIFFVQLFIISIYRNTGLLPLNPISSMQNTSIILPILVLSIIPTISLFQFQLLLMEEEKNKEYVTYAKAKGFSERYIMFQHILRNIIVSLLNHIESILLALVTSILVFEYLFHIKGLFSLLINGQDPAVVVYLLLLFVSPIYGVIVVVNWLRRTVYA
ncbi:ABC transporter permease subunit [Bacillus manliponensis]|uniref:ABC transporter permease subunit n=1 Tax=Bacillus manliponensis TaxID=574376 RepID=UPI000AFF47BF|nr:ABC transporter permease subunit [Bacillus manliponensis]